MRAREPAVQIRRYSAFYVLIFLTWGAVSPYWPVFLAAHGWHQALVGALLLAQRSVAMVAAPAVGYLADRYGARKVMLVSLVGRTWLQTGACVSAIFRTSRALTFALIVAGAVVGAGISPMCDRATVGWLKKAGRPHDYGKIRLFGAIGWGIGALASTAALPDYESHFFVSLIIVTLIILPFTHFLEFHETGQGSSDGEEDDSDESDDGDNSTNDNSNENGGERGDDGDTENESETIKEDEQVDEREDAKLISNAMMNDAEDDGIPRSILPKKKKKVPKTILQVFTMPANVAFFLIVMGQGILMGIIANNLFVFVDDVLNGSSVLLGFMTAFTTAGEIPFFFFHGALQRKLSSFGILALAAACLGIRLFSYSQLPNFPSLWLILPIELLHGVTYAAMWGAAVARAAEIAPPGKANTMQGILGSIYFGAGAGVGALIGGEAADHFGHEKTFLVSALLAMGICAVVLVGMALAKTKRVAKQHILQ